MKRAVTRWWILSLVPVLVNVPPAACGQDGPQDHWVREDNLAWSVNDTRAICCMSNRVYVAQSALIRVYTLTGDFITSWGTAGSGSGQFGSINDLACDSNELFVLDEGNQRVHAFEADGTFVRDWSTAALSQSSRIAVDNGRAYITDRVAHEVNVFDTSGAFLFSWGGYGTVAGKLRRPTDISVNHGLVDVLDGDNKRIQTFTTEGEFVRVVEVYPEVNLSTVDAMASDATAIYVELSTGGSPKSVFRVLDRYGNVHVQWLTGWYPNWIPHIGVGSPFVYIGVGDDVDLVVPYRRIFRTLGSTANNAIPEAGLLATEQREGTPLLDIDYSVEDRDDTTSTVYAAAFTIGAGGTPSLENMIPMLTFVEGTASNIGAGVAVDVPHRVTWDMDADQVESLVDGYGNLNISLMASDGRPPLDLHFITIPAIDTNSSFQINRAPLYDRDFLPIWFWYLASGDSALNLTTGCVFGVGGAYDGQLLAQDTDTTPAGRSFLFERLGVREATGHELQVAREASTPGVVTEWTPRRQPPPASYRVNEFNFVTSPTTGWWAVKTTP